MYMYNFEITELLIIQLNISCRWMVKSDMNVVTGGVKVILPKGHIYNNNNNTGSIFCFTATFYFLSSF